MNNHNNTYIFESPDNGVTIYKRKFMDYEHKTEIKQTSIPNVISAIRDNNTKKHSNDQDSNLFDKVINYLSSK